MGGVIAFCFFHYFHFSVSSLFLLHLSLPKLKKGKRTKKIPQEKKSKTNQHSQKNPCNWRSKSLNVLSPIYTDHRIWARCAETWNNSAGNLFSAGDTKKLLPIALYGNKRAFPLRQGVSCDPSYPSSFPLESIAKVYSVLFPCIPAGSSVTLPWGWAAGTNSKCHPGTPTITLQVRLCPQRCWGSAWWPHSHQGILPEIALRLISRNQFPKADSPFPNLATIYPIYVDIIEQTFVRVRTRSLCFSLTILLPEVWLL